MQQSMKFWINADGVITVSGHATEADKEIIKALEKIGKIVKPEWNECHPTTSEEFWKLTPQERAYHLCG